MTTNFDNIFIEDNNEIKPIVIIDGHNIAYRCLYSIIFSNPEDINQGFYLWKHTFLNSIFNIVTKLNPSKLILAFDGKSSWRYEYYSKYKAHRKESREKSKLNWNDFFTIFDEFIQDISDTFTNIYVLKFSKVEGDDIIGVLTMDVFKNEQVIIVSNDSDMKQLLIYPNVKLYDNKTSTFVDCINPKIELEIKILQGDSSDNITGIKRLIGAVTAQKIYNMGVDTYINTYSIKVNRNMKLSEWMTQDDIAIYCPIINENGQICADERPKLTNEEILYYIEKEKQMMRNNYDRNTLLINLKYIPQNIKDIIINSYNNYNITSIIFKKLLLFFTKHKLNKHFTDWNNISVYFKTLN